MCASGTLAQPQGGSTHNEEAVNRSSEASSEGMCVPWPLWGFGRCEETVGSPHGNGTLTPELCSTWPRTGTHQERAASSLFVSVSNSVPKTQSQTDPKAIVRDARLPASPGASFPGHHHQDAPEASLCSSPELSHSSFAFEPLPMTRLPVLARAESIALCTLLRVVFIYFNTPFLLSGTQMWDEPSGSVSTSELEFVALVPLPGCLPERHSSVLQFCKALLFGESVSAI